MEALTPRLEPPLRLADRLAAARRQRFVGRTGELDLFRSALRETEPPFAVLHVHGPGGVGKTSLLREYASIAEENGVPVLLLDARHIDPSPLGFLFAFRQVLGIEENASPLDALTRLPRAVIMIDTYETLAPLDSWLREILLPQLPASCLVVVAGRNPPAPAWRTEAGWSDLVRVVSLRNLSPDESRSLLQVRGVPRDQHNAAIEVTHGHPLALLLIADVLVQGDDWPADTPEKKPDIVQILLERFIQQVPGPAHRRALEVCAHVRVTTEALLSEVLAVEDVRAVFDWLRGLSFVEQGPQGLFPHDLAREVLDADRRWRDPDGYRQLHRQVRDYIVRKVQATQGIAQQRAFLDLLYLHRNNPIMRPHHDWKTLGSAYIEPAREHDFPTIVDLVRRHEGEASADLTTYWLRRQPNAFVVFRRSDTEIIGFSASLALHLATPEDLAIDPAARAAWNYALRYGPTRPGDEMVYHRFAMDRDEYQRASPGFSLVVTDMCTQWLTRPKLSWCFLAVADPDYWQSMMAYINFQRAPEADFTVEDRHFAIYAHDWRVEPAFVWLDIMAERELATDVKAEMLEPQPSAPLVVLSRSEFADAVRRALRDHSRPQALGANPLLRSRLVVAQVGKTPTADNLRALIREAVETLKTSPKDEKLYRAIHRTYLEPATTQELAAELLGLPFSTYRYHLTNGIGRVVELLWQREVHGLDN